MRKGEDDDRPRTRCCRHHGAAPRRHGLRERRAPLRRRARSPAALGLPAPRPRADRHPRRLRARRLRRLHRPRRRPADALVPHVRRHGAGPRDHHRRGPLLGARRARRPDRRIDEPGPAGLRRVPRAPVRLLHTGLPHDRHGLPRGEPLADERASTRGDLGQPLPLHRLPEHRQERPARRRDQGRAGGGAGVTTQMFGAPIRRKEDPRLVTGGGRYLDDLGHDALAAAFVRSPHAHARIVDIDASEAIEVEGVVGIYVHEDLPGRVGEPLPLLIPHPTLTHGRTGYALAKDEVNHVGEPIVMVVATDRYVAEDACQRIRVTYDQLPVVVGIEAARSGELLVHDDVPDNVAAHMLQEVGDVDAAMAAAPHTLTLDLDIERSECIAPDVGGGFGVKIVHPWPEEVLVPWAAILLGRPVKWAEDRREHFISAAHERGQLQRVTVGFDDEGHLLALDVKLWHDNGAYTPYGIIVPIITSTQLLGPYKPGTYRCEFWSLYTNTVLVTPYRGAGRPQGCFAMERTMDAIADELGLDRAEVRSRNFILPTEMPWDHGLLFQDGRPLKYDSG